MRGVPCFGLGEGNQVFLLVVAEGLLAFPAVAGLTEELPPFGVVLMLQFTRTGMEVHREAMAARMRLAWLWGLGSAVGAVAHLSRAADDVRFPVLLVGINLEKVLAGLLDGAAGRERTGVLEAQPVVLVPAGIFLNQFVKR